MTFCRSLYVAEIHRVCEIEPIAYAWSIDDCAKDALNRFSRLTQAEKNKYWVDVIELTISVEEMIDNDPEKTYFSVLNRDLEELGHLREIEISSRLNRVEYKVFPGVVHIYDEFFNTVDFDISCDTLDCYDDEYAAIDDLYDICENELIIDKEYLKDSNALAVVEGMIQSIIGTIRDVREELAE